MMAGGGGGKRDEGGGREGGCGGGEGDGCDVDRWGDGVSSGGDVGPGVGVGGLWWLER